MTMRIHGFVKSVPTIDEYEKLREKNDEQGRRTTVRVFIEKPVRGLETVFGVVFIDEVAEDFVYAELLGENIVFTADESSLHLVLERGGQHGPAISLRVNGLDWELDQDKPRRKK